MVTETEVPPAAPAFSLLPNYPNPFSRHTTIAYRLAEAAAVDVSVYDVAGQKVATLLERRQAPGLHRLPFDAAGLAAGTYLVRLRAGTAVRTRTLTVVR